MSDSDFVSFEDDLDQEDLASHRAHRCTPQEARDRLTAGNDLFLQGIHDHEMHSEYCVIPQETADVINATKAAGGRVGLCDGCSETEMLGVNTVEQLSEVERIIRSRA